MRYYLIFIMLICLIFGCVLPVAAYDIDDAPYYGTITITNNGTAGTIVSANISNINTDELIDNHFLSSSANDCAVISGGSDLNFMPGYDTSPWIIFLNYIGAYTSDTAIAFLPNAAGNIRWFPGTNGGTTSYNAAITPNGGTSWDIRISAYFDMSSGSNKDVYYDANLCRIYVSTANVMKLEFLGGGGGSISCAMATGEHTLRVYQDIPGGVGEIFIDGASSVNGSCAVAGTTPATVTYVRNGVCPFVEYIETRKNGVITQRIEWEYDTTFHDSVNSYDVTPTFRTSSSDADVSAVLTSFNPVSQPTAPTYVIGSGADFLSDNITVSGNFTTGNTSLSYPGGAVIKAIASATATPSQFPETIIATFIILAVSICFSALFRRYGSGSTFIKIIILVAGFGIAIAVNVYDWWMLVFLFIFALTAIYASNERVRV